MSMFRRNVLAQKSIYWKRFRGVKEKRRRQVICGLFNIYWEGAVVALKHNYKKYIIPLFLVVLWKDLHHNSDAFLEDRIGLRWLKQSELEDPLVYQIGYRDDRDSPENSNFESYGFLWLAYEPPGGLTRMSNTENKSCKYSLWT